MTELASSTQPFITKQSALAKVSQAVKSESDQKTLGCELSTGDHEHFLESPPGLSHNEKEMKLSTYQSNATHMEAIPWSSHEANPRKATIATLTEDDHHVTCHSNQIRQMALGALGSPDPPVRMRSQGTMHRPVSHFLVGNDIERMQNVCAMMKIEPKLKCKI